jgi:hypothetical protein
MQQFAQGVQRLILWRFGLLRLLKRRLQLEDLGLLP